MGGWAGTGAAIRESESVRTRESQEGDAGGLAVANLKYKIETPDEKSAARKG
jgi:hypothetical protein